MAFSRQHYVKFAEILKKMSDRKSQLYLAGQLLKMFLQDNPRFDTDRFLKAAGMESSPALAKAMEESVVTEGTVDKALFDKAKHKGDVYCSHCAGTGKEPPQKKEDCFQCDGKGYLTLKDLKRLEKARVYVSESAPSMKLMELLPNRDTGNRDVYELLDELRDDLEEAEFAGDDEWNKAIHEFNMWGKKYKYDTAPLSKTLAKLRSAFWMGVRKAVDAEMKKNGG